MEGLKTINDIKPPRVIYEKPSDDVGQKLRQRHYGRSPVLLAAVFDDGYRVTHQLERINP